MMGKELRRKVLQFRTSSRKLGEGGGKKISGTSPDGLLVEMVEIPSHPYFIAGQFHPELKSRPNRPGPLFVGLVEVAKNNRK